MKKSNKYVLVIGTIMVINNPTIMSAQTTTSVNCELSQQCKSTNIVWTNYGVLEEVVTGIKGPRSTLVKDYQQSQVSNEGSKRIISVDKIIEKYDDNGNIESIETSYFDKDGKLTSKKLENFIYNPLTNKTMLSRTRFYDNGVLTANHIEQTTWSGDGAKKSTKGIDKQKNGTYIEDYTEYMTSNFGQQKWIRKDYIIYKYDNNGHLRSMEDREYNANGDETSRMVYDYKYDLSKKQSTKVRARKYVGKKVVSDVKASSKWQNDGKKTIIKKGKKNTANATYIEETKQKQVSNFGETRSVLVDSNTMVYNAKKQLVSSTNFDYDRNGQYKAKKEYTYYYNKTTNKLEDTRIRTYNGERLTSNLKKSQVKRPLKSGMITNEFNGVDLTYQYGHDGIDIAAPTGTPIYPTMPGKIIEISSDSIGGNKVVIHHNINGIDYISYYGHMSKLTNNYKVGDQVTTKSQIGTVGTSGLTTGPHVHFELMIDTNVKNRNNAVNPRTYIDFPKLWGSY